MTVDAKRLQAIFTAAIAMNGLDERSAFIDRACGNDLELRSRVDSLLAAHDDPASLPSIGQKTMIRLFGEEAGAVIAGRYKLLERIGEGGMGTVWLAEQIEPVRRRVALKLIKAGMDTKTVLARFDAERQALAVMDHPNIAKVFDGGTTESGRPYFVMEYVKGMPITDYCDKARLSIQKRLELFVQVCSAVQHAHQKGVIHRDLKPTNILVAPYDAVAVPKVIDFGLAKAMHHSLTDWSLHTGHEMILGTPLYMAPEQAQWNNLDIDTRADIYSLGVLLYELLTGTTPLEKKRFKEFIWDEIKRVIREEEPPPPSARLSSTEQLPSLAACRQSEPAHLTRLIRGELDWIVMKALEKERSRRYDTANSLALDVQRYLHGEAIQAAPPSRRYRLQKMVRKHRASMATLAIVLIALISGLGFSLWQMQRANHERDEKDQALTIAQQAREEARQAAAKEKQARVQAEKRLAQIEKGVALLANVLTGINPRMEKLRGDPLYVQLRKRAEQASVELADETVGDPLTVAHLQTVLGNTLLDLGSYQSAVAVLEKAMTTRVQLLAKDDLETLNTKQYLALAYQMLGEQANAVQMYNEVLQARTRQLGANHPQTLSTMNNLASAYEANGQLPEAIKLFEQVIDRQTDQLGFNHPDTLITRNNLACALKAAGRSQEAISIFEQVSEAQATLFGTEHTDTLNTLQNLASTYQTAGRLADAIRLLERIRDCDLKKFGPDHPDTLGTLHSLAVAYAAADRLPEAMRMLEQVRDKRNLVLGPDHPDSLNTLEKLADMYRMHGQLPKAIQLLEQVRDVRVHKLGANHHMTLVAVNNLALAYRSVGRHPEAMRLFEQVRDAFMSRFGPDHPDTLASINNLAGTYFLVGKQAEAIQLYQQLLRSVDRALGSDHPHTLTTVNSLGEAYRAVQRWPDALPLFERAAQGVSKHQFMHPYARAIMQNVIGAYTTNKQLDRAEAWQRQWSLHIQSKHGQTSKEYASELASLGLLQLQQAHWAEAETTLRDCLAIREQAQPDSWTTSNTLAMLGGALLGQGKYGPAEPLLLKGFQGMHAQLHRIEPSESAALHLRLLEACDRLITLYSATNQPDEVAKWRVERAKYDAK